jgi:ankyrin repeat protein
MIAAYQNHVKVLKFLIAKGADFNAKTNNGATALGLAEKKGNTEVAALLKEAGAK